jgi:hypothetical protein
MRAVEILQPPPRRMRFALGSIAALAVMGVKGTVVHSADFFRPVASETAAAMPGVVYMTTVHLREQGKRR